MIRNYYNNINNEKNNTTSSTTGTINYLTDIYITNNQINDDQTLIIENKIEKIIQNFNKKKIKELEEDIKGIDLEEIFEKNLSIKENEFNIGTLNSLDDLIEDIYHLKPFEEENKNSDKPS